MAYELILRAIYSQPWAILPEKGAALLEVVLLRASGVRFTPREIEERIGAVDAASRQPRQAGSIAVLPLRGVISQRMDLFSDSSGGTSTERFGQLFRAALNDAQVGGIVIDIDSPGGGVYGVEELAGEIYRARGGQKPITAVANSLAASAAYWIASAADELIVTPGGEVGGIGVYAAHEDLSKALEMDGVNMSLISAGKYKTELSPYGPLSDEARAYVQGRVDDYYTMFTRTVARQRGVPVEQVRSGFGEGRVVGARQAVELGMADGVATLDEAIERTAKAMRHRDKSALDLRQRRIRLQEARAVPTNGRA